MIDPNEAMTQGANDASQQPPAWNDPAFPPDRWQRIMMANLKFMHTVQPRSPEWLAAKAHVDEAVANLNKHEQRNVDVTRVTDVPRELGEYGKGIGQGAVGMVKGVGQLLDQTFGQGDPVGALKSVGHGAVQLAKNIVAPARTAIHEAESQWMGGPETPGSELDQSLSQGGQASAVLGAMYTPKLIKRLNEPGPAQYGPAAAGGRILADAERGYARAPGDPLDSPAYRRTGAPMRGKYGATAPGEPQGPDYSTVSGEAQQTGTSVTPAQPLSMATSPGPTEAGAVPSVPRLTGDVTQVNEGSPGFKPKVEDLLRQIQDNPEAGFTTPEVLSFLLGRTLGMGGLRGLRGLPYSSILQGTGQGALGSALSIPDTTGAR